MNTIYYTYWKIVPHNSSRRNSLFLYDDFQSDEILKREKRAFFEIQIFPTFFSNYIKKIRVIKYFSLALLKGKLFNVRILRKNY